MTPEEIAAAAAAEAEKAAAEKATADAATAAAAAAKGKSQPSDAEAALLKEVMDKKAALKTANQKAIDLEAKLKSFDGIDLVEITKLLADKKQAEQTDLEKRGEFDRVKQQMVEEHTKAMEALMTSSTTATSTLKSALDASTNQITELTIGRSFGDSPFVRDSLTLTPSKARVIYGAHFELADGVIVAYDKPAGSASRTQLVDGKGDPLSFDLAMEKIVGADPDKDHLLRSKMKSGAGSKSDSKIHEQVEVGSGRERIAAAIAAGALQLPKSN